MSFKPYLAYSASAGSGKTFALAVRYVSLLFMGESPRSILAATFTNKAAAQMRQRVVDSLRRIGDEGNEAFVDAIAVQTGLTREALLAKQPEVLAGFLGSSSYIVTLDSFFSSVLRSASLELGLEPDFVTKEQPHQMLESHFLDEVQRGGMLGSLVKLAIDIEDKRFTKIFDLLQNFYRADPLLPPISQESLSLSRQEEQVEVLRFQIVKALGEAGSAPRCTKQFEVNSVKELFAKDLFAKDCLADHSWFKKSINSDIEALYLQLKEALLLWARAKEAIVLRALFKIYDYYKNATIANAKHSGILSFDDLTYFTYRLLHESISKEFLYFKIDSKFKHILLDEFQDTSTLQFLLLKPLIDEIFAGVGQSEFKSFFYVGDTKQSLYRFRGGVEELFDKVAERYGVKIEQMDTNYRSSQNVIEQVNEWFSGTMPEYLPQKCKTGATEGYVEVVESEEPINEAVSQAKRLMAKGIDIDTLAFLVSTNKDGIALQEACEKEGIATLLQTSSSLKNTPKIAALVAMVEYLFYGEAIDAAPLLQIVGKSYAQLDTSWFHPISQPVVVMDRLVREFGYFDNDLNILKLLEFAGKFSDIPTFLGEFKNASIAVASPTVHGAKIMTIHGSKGLEFERVIVLDKLTRQNSDKTPLVYHYNDALAIDQILYRIAKRENFDENYRHILQERKVLENKDHKNVLYVALTRAIESLIVIKKSKNSIFDEINMVPMRSGELEEGSEKAKDIVVQRSMTTLMHYGTQEIVKHSDDDEKDLEAILFGTALHYLLEMMGAFEQKSLDEAMISLRNRFGQVLQEEKIEEIYRRAKMLIEDFEFQQLLLNAHINQEQSLSFEGELKQIDLFLEYENTCLVIDYKSSMKYQVRHNSQVAQYQRAIEKITAKKTSGMIVYLLEEKIVLKSLN